MSLKKAIGKVGDLQLDIKPRSLFFQGGRAKPFALYIEKGRQVIGQFKSDLKHNPKECKYIFSSQPRCFRLSNLQNTQYSWSIYSVDAQDMCQTHMETTVFDIKSCVEAYQTDISRKQKELQALHKDHCSNPEAMLDIWKLVKSQITSRTVKLECLFKKQRIHLQFVLCIRNVLDEQLALKEKEKEKMQRKPKQKPLIFSSSPDLKNDASYSPRSPQLLRDDTLFEQQVQDKSGGGQQPEVKGSPSLGEFKITKILSQIQIEKQSPPRLGGNQKDEEDQNQQNEDYGYSDPFIQSIGVGQSLSDIMERSYEGSSSYGQSHIQNNKNSGFKFSPKRARLGQSFSHQHIETDKRINKSDRQHILIRQQPEKDQSASLLLESKCLTIPETSAESNMTSQPPTEYRKGKKIQLKWIVCFFVLLVFIIIGAQLKMGNRRRKLPKLKRRIR